jgi:hypothetical protein
MKGWREIFYIFPTATGKTKKGWQQFKNEVFTNTFHLLNF